MCVLLKENLYTAGLIFMTRESENARIMIATLYTPILTAIKDIVPVTENDCLLDCTEGSFSN